MLNDLSAYWMPFTANRQFKAAPRLLVAADGHVLHHRRTGARCSTAPPACGASTPAMAGAEIVDAIRAPGRARSTTPPRSRWATRWRSSWRRGSPRPRPGDLDHVFFANSGSEAVDTALKIALAYHHARGETGRVRLIGRERGYHGVGFGGIVGGRHRQQPQAVRSDAAGRRPSAPYPRPRPQRVLARPARLGRASRRRARRT